MDATELRAFIGRRTPCLSRAVGRVPATGGPEEMEELSLIAQAVPQPDHATKGSQRYFSALPNVDAWLIPRHRTPANLRYAAAFHPKGLWSSAAG